MIWRNEVDSYGFSNILAKIVKKKNLPYPLANWQHDWHFWKEISKDNINYNNKVVPTILANKKLKLKYKKLGFKYLYIGGLPFTYTRQIKKRIKSSVIFIPPKNHKTSFALKKTENIINNNFDKYKNKTILLNKNDQKFLKKLCSKKKIKIINSISKNNENALQVLRNLLDQYEYMITNTIGSHIIYALYCGCKVKVFEKNFYDYSDYDYSFQFDYHERRKKYDYRRKVYSLGYVKKHYNFLFKFNSIKNINIKKWVEYETGAKFKLNKNEILNLLSLNFFGKFKRVYYALCSKFKSNKIW